MAREPLKQHVPPFVQRGLYADRHAVFQPMRLPMQRKISRLQTTVEFRICDAFKILAPCGCRPGDHPPRHSQIAPDLARRRKSTCPCQRPKVQPRREGVQPSQISFAGVKVETSISRSATRSRAGASWENPDDGGPAGFGLFDQGQNGFAVGRIQ